MSPRVVLVPGLMGSAMADSSIGKPDAEALCAMHWDSIPRIRDALRRRGNVLCGDESNLIWGRAPFLHWLADLRGWLELMSRGDGYKVPGAIVPTQLTELIIQRGKRKDPHSVEPYSSLVRALDNKGASLLKLPYDWRLRAPLAVAQLQAAIMQEWWK